MKKLKQIIIEKGIKQKWLAQRIGVSEVTLSNWVKGIYKPYDENIEKIARALNIDKEKLYAGRR